MYQIGLILEEVSDRIVSPIERFIGQTCSNGKDTHAASIDGPNLTWHRPTVAPVNSVNSK